MDFGNWQHVYPLNDLIEHITDKGPVCPCGPKLDIDHEIIIHAAMDRREVFEKNN